MPRTDRLVAENPPDFFREFFRKGLPTSVDELEWGSPILSGLKDLAHSPVLKVHSIIAVRPDSSPDQRTDGLVSYEALTSQALPRRKSSPPAISARNMRRSLARCAASSRNTPRRTDLSGSPWPSDPQANPARPPIGQLTISASPAHQEARPPTGQLTTDN